MQENECTSNEYRRMSATGVTVNTRKHVAARLTPIVYGPRSVLSSNNKKDLRNSGLNGDSNPGLCDLGALLYYYSYQDNWQVVVMWVDDKPV